MGKKLTKKELEAKKKYHDKRYEYYVKKLEDLEKEEKQIGFKHYN